MSDLFLLLFMASGISSLVFLIRLIMKKPKALRNFLVSIGVGVFSFVAFSIAIIIEDFDEVDRVDSVIDADVKEVASEEIDGQEDVREPEDITEKYVELGKQFEVNGLIIVIEDVEIDEKYVTIGVSARNESGTTKSFYPSQGDIVIGNKQLSSNFLMNKGDTWGDIYDGVEKSSKFRYVADDDGLKPSDISEIRLVYGKVRDSESHEYEEFDEVISLD